MSISLIVAHDLQKNIGRENQLLCRLPNDLRRFKQLTKNEVVVMGRKTYESIGRGLPNRTNIVLTRDRNYQPNDYNVHVYHSIEDILQEYNDYGKPEGVHLHCIGGSEIYSQFLPYVDKLFITVIHNVFEADARFPEVDYSNYKLIDQSYNSKDDEHEYSFTYLTYERIK